MAKRKMTALQRRYFGRRRSSRRSSAVSPRRRRATRYAKTRRSSGRRGGGLGSWLPLTKQEHIDAAVAGASMGFVVPKVREFTDNWTGFLGDYQGEGTMYAIGAIAKKFGSGIVAGAGKDYAIIATAAAAGRFTAPFINGTSGQTASTAGVTMLN